MSAHLHLDFHRHTDDAELNQGRERAQVKTGPKLQLKQQKSPPKETTVEPEVTLTTSGILPEVEKRSAQITVSLSHTNEKSFYTKEIVEVSQVPVMPTYPSKGNAPSPRIAKDLIQSLNLAKRNPFFLLHSS